MGKVLSELSMSLDGFIAGAKDGPDLPLGEGGERLFDWYSNGNVELTVPSGGMVFKLSPASAARFQEGIKKIGALVTGRRTFDITHGWGGRHPMDVPVVVVTHSIPKGWEQKNYPFTFITDGIEHAIAQAKAIAGEKDVAVGAASVVQQCLRAGLLDEIQVDLVPVLLGQGVRLFDNLGDKPIQLEITQVIEGLSVTHLVYRVIK